MAVWERFSEILDCTNADEDAASLPWQQATDMVVNGEAAFNIMGDWAAGYMSTTLGLTPGEGFGWAPAPGTEGVFNMLADSFGLPVGAPNRDNVIAWLRLLGSVEGQDVFNPLKGSIAARTDSDLSKYNAYLQSAAEDWQTNEIVGSLAHGAVAPETFSSFATDGAVPGVAERQATSAAERSLSRPGSPEPPNKRCVCAPGDPVRHEQALL